MRKNYIIYLFFISFFGKFYAQNVVDEFEVPTQSFLKFNTVAINSSLSVFYPEKASVLTYYRNQSLSETDAQKNYLLNFNSSKMNKHGYGLSVYQKTIGVWQNYGAVANYGKGIALSENSFLALGFNVVFYKTDLNSKAYVFGVAGDPILSNYEPTQMAIINPGISVQINRFNIGATVGNLFDYNFVIKNQQTDFANKTYSGHLHYSNAKNESNSLFENANLSLIVQGKYKQEYEIEATAGAVYNAPKIGWLQGSFNNINGVSVGGGVAVNSKIAIGYNFEKNIQNKRTDIGASHDVFLTYSFGVNETEETKPKKKEYTALSLEKEEIQRYKKKVYNKDIVEDELKTKEKLETFIKNLEQENINYLLLPEKNIGIKKGYYLVTKVLISSTIAKNKTDEQKKNGFKKSSFFTTASGDWNYVYLERFDNELEAIKSYLNNYNNKYKDPLWILPIL